MDEGGTDPAAARGADGPPTRGTVLLTCVLFLGFVLLAFSEDFISAVNEHAITRIRWLLPTVDIALLAIAVLLAALAARRNGGWQVGVFWCVLAVLSTFGLDVAQVCLRRHNTYDGGWPILFLLLYVLSLTALTAGVVGTRMPFFHRRPDLRQQTAERFRIMLPLLIGTLAAYLGSWLWNLLADSDLRPNQEYFAQVSQVIPLMLVAIGLEARAFRDFSRHTVGRAATIFMVVALSLGEALTLIVLTFPPDESLSSGPGWTEYAAFMISMEAVFVALAMLVWALLWPRMAHGESSLHGSAAPRQSAATDREADAPSPPLPATLTLPASPGRSRIGGGGLIVTAAAAFVVGTIVARRFGRRGQGYRNAS